MGAVIGRYSIGHLPSSVGYFITQSFEVANLSPILGSTISVRKGYINVVSQKGWGS